MPGFVRHRLIKEGTLQARLYQQQILGRAVKENLLVVLPTGLGKTPIAVLLAVHCLERFPDKAVLVLAPTKPLANQHLSSFVGFIDMDRGLFQAVTGEMSPGERAGLYGSKRLIFATPQTIRNDVEKGRLDLSVFSLLVFDEAHHAIGGYAYPYIARKYAEQAKEPRILALSASPGASQQKIDEICENLGVKAVDVRTENDTDVSPYVKKKEMENIMVSLPASFVELRDAIYKVYEKKLSYLRKFGFGKPVRIINKKDLLNLQARFMGELKSGSKYSFAAVSVVTQCIKLEHALGLLETQGIRPLMEYLEKMGKNKTKADKILSNDAGMNKAVVLARRLSERGSRHPKVSKLCAIVDSELRRKPDSRIIVFANYRTTVDDIVSSVSGIGGARPVKFVGQKEGVTQKHQLETIRRFREGDYNVLVATAVGEEGLDIPSANLAIFYEPVPSPLRSIQRRGRVGRADIGKVIMLITEGTRDEGYYWTAHHKEKRMKSILRGMKGEGNAPEGKKNTLEGFIA